MVVTGFSKIRKARYHLLTRNVKPLKFRVNPCDATRERPLQGKSNYENAYWTELCQDTQACANAGDVAGIYVGIKRAIGPTPKKTAPLKEIDASIITNSGHQMLRCR